MKYINLRSALGIGKLQGNIYCQKDNVAFQVARGAQDQPHRLVWGRIAIRLWFNYPVCFLEEEFETAIIERNKWLRGLGLPLGSEPTSSIPE